MSEPSNIAAAHCVGRAPLFDLDIGRLPQWQQAMALCRSCPIKNECASLARTVGPKSMIWAAQPYNEHGDLLDEGQLRRRDALRGAEVPDQPGLWAS